jgi:hypothetical protein
MSVILSSLARLQWLHFQCLSNYDVSSARYSIPWSQILDTFCPERKVALRSILRNLRCSKISIGRVSAGVLSKPGGTMSLSARVSVPRAVLRSSSTSIGPYKSSESTILRCSVTKGWKIRRDGAQFTWSATGPDLYLLRRIYSTLGIRPRHTGLPGQAYPPGFLYGLLGSLVLGRYKLSQSLVVALQTLVQDGDIERVLSCYRDLMTQRDVTFSEVTTKTEENHRDNFYFYLLGNYLLLPRAEFRVIKVIY